MALLGVVPLTTAPQPAPPDLLRLHAHQVRVQVRGEVALQRSRQFQCAPIGCLFDLVRLAKPNRIQLPVQLVGG